MLVCATYAYAHPDAGVCRVSVHSLELAGVKDLALGFCCP